MHHDQHDEDCCYRRHLRNEWESAEAFEKFFSDPELQNFIGSVGGDTNSAPEIIIVESIDSPEKF